MKSYHYVHFVILLSGRLYTRHLTNYIHYSFPFPPVLTVDGRLGVAGELLEQVLVERHQLWAAKRSDEASDSTGEGVEGSEKNVGLALG